MERRIIDVLMLVAPPAAASPLPTSEAASLLLSKCVQHHNQSSLPADYGDGDYDGDDDEADIYVMVECIYDKKLPSGGRW